MRMNSLQLWAIPFLWDHAVPITIKRSQSGLFSFALFLCLGKSKTKQTTNDCRIEFCLKRWLLIKDPKSDRANLLLFTNPFLLPHVHSVSVFSFQTQLAFTIKILFSNDHLILSWLKHFQKNYYNAYSLSWSKAHNDI